MAASATWIYFVIMATVLGLMTLLALLGEYKFTLLENFVGGPDPASWMPTASGRNPEGSPKESEEELQGADASAPYNLLGSERLVGMTAEESIENVSRMTSERCFRYDMAEPLRKVRNFLQRTNNYSRSHPDSCSAPNHEMIGTFYRPHEGVGAQPAAGDRMPLGALSSYSNAAGTSLLGHA